MIKALSMRVTDSRARPRPDFQWFLGKVENNYYQPQMTVKANTEPFIVLADYKRANKKPVRGIPVREPRWWTTPSPDSLSKHGAVDSERR